MMTDADIERVASAVATKLINARLAELQAVREAALEEGRLAGTKAERERIQAHNEAPLARIEQLTRMMEQRGELVEQGALTLAQVRILAVEIRVQAGFLSPPRPV